jgi:hypothetical protein
LGAVIVPPWVAGSAVLLDNLYLHRKETSLISPEVAIESLTPQKN